MSLEKFPLVCFKLEGEMILGKVLGLDIVVIEENTKKVKKTAAESLQKLVKNGVNIDTPDMENPVLQTYKVPVQLSYKEEWGNFPLASETAFKVVAVHSAEHRSGIGECYLPWLDIDFYYYNREQRTSLIKHYAGQFLQSGKPEEAYPYVMSSEPWLESITADLIPTAKSFRKQISRLPETAWERSDLVSSCTQFLLEGNGNCLLVGDRGVGKSLLWQEASKAVAKLEFAMRWWMHWQALTACFGLPTLLAC